MVQLFVLSNYILVAISLQYTSQLSPVPCLFFHDVVPVGVAVEEFPAIAQAETTLVGELVDSNSGSGYRSSSSRVLKIPSGLETHGSIPHDYQSTLLLCCVVTLAAL